MSNCILIGMKGALSMTHFILICHSNIKELSPDVQSLEMRQKNANVVDCQKNRELSEYLVRSKPGRKLYISRHKEYN